jgi:hypothetical protein
MHLNLPYNLSNFMKQVLRAFPKACWTFLIVPSSKHLVYFTRFSMALLALGGTGFFLKIFFVLSETFAFFLIYFTLFTYFLSRLTFTPPFVFPPMVFLVLSNVYFFPEESLGPFIVCIRRSILKASKYE